MTVDDRGLARDLGVPVVLAAARQGVGIDRLLKEIDDMANGRTTCRPHRLEADVPAVRDGVKELVAELETTFPHMPHAEWVALRLLEGDERIAEAVASGEIGTLGRDHAASSAPQTEGGQT